ncbi:MAG: ABC transporter permease [Melioribacteraceae bacterium]|nr:ABC transporter permease [Melioribacteraceae bacterium]
MFEFFVAKKYVRSKNRSSFISIISAVSTLGVSIGVAALIIVISVFNGFGEIVHEMLQGFDPHVQVRYEESKNQNFIIPEKELNNSHIEIKYSSTFIDGKAILVTDRSYEIINLKGIGNEAEREYSALAKILVAGDAQFTAKNQIILGSQMAIKLRKFIGDTVLVTSFKKVEKALTGINPIPEIKPFVVKGIFQSNNKDYDYNSSFTSLTSAQEVFASPGRISGMEFWLNDINQSENFKKIIESSFQNSGRITINTWYDLHRNLYDVMQIEKWAAYFLLGLIIAVSTFNILSSLSMSVIEKKKDIAVLQTLGATQYQIKKIFFIEGILIAIIGTITGTVIGLLVCYLQIEFNFYPLDPQKFIIDAMPIKVLTSDVVYISVIAFLLTSLASIYPAKKAASQSIIESIKWE